MKKIKFDLNGDNRPYIEGLEEAKDSMFRDQYEQCILLIDAYLKGVKNMQETPVALRNSVDNNNNIVVFDGERGTGKTSCMLSMANMLTSEHHEAICQNAKYAAEAEFLAIPMIDPSFFDEEHNILSLFIARLYRVFQEKEESEECVEEGTGNKYRTDLMKMFVTVQQNLRSMFGDKKAKDGMEYLVDMAASVDIRENIQKLVDLYLKYSGCKDGVLLLLVDDIDIDSDHAYEMCEQLRKYFMQPNIITLMSMKIAQLSGIIQRKYTEEYLVTDDGTPYRRFQRVNYSERNEIAQRAERYLAKLLPAHQRIYMPSPSEYMDAEPVFNDKERWGYNLSDGIKIKQVIPELIFLKTRYLFYNSAKRVSYIVPRNLRDMRQMFKLLLQMNDYAESGEANPHYYNKEMFRQYFYNDWCDINLTEEYKEYADRVKRVQNMEELNYEVLQILDDITESNLKNRTGNEIVDKILSPHNTPFNISVGDVLAIIRLTQRTKMGEDVRKFLFFLRSFYSIQLYGAYDSISSSSEKEKEQERANLLIQKPEHDVVWNDYEAIVGGSVYCTDLDELIPQEYNSNKISRSVISLGNIDNLFELCLNDWQKASEQNLIRLAEFLMLTIYYDGSKELSMQLSFRSSPDLCYDAFSLHTDLYFDLGALFFNLCRVERCFNRFQVLPHGRAFLDMLKSERSEGRDPLFNDMKQLTLQNRHKEWKNDEEKWLSFCCFRNMEIMEDLLDTVRAKEYDKGLDSYGMLHDFFEAVANYSIKSYDRYDDDRTGEEDKPYTIHFEFFRKCTELFSSENAAVKNHFMSIFNPPTIKDPFEDDLDAIIRNS